MLKGAVFDFDGTLADSMSVWKNIGKNYLCSIGCEPKENIEKITENMSLYRAVRYFKYEYGVLLSTDEIVGGIKSMLKYYYENEVKLKPFANDFLNKLKENEVKMCIVSASDKDFIESVLEKYKIRDCFCEIFTCDIAKCEKSEPKLYRLALESLQTEKYNTIVFEDALYAIKTAKNDGFIVAALQDIYEKNQAEVKKTADIYLNDFSDFDGFLREYEKCVDNCGK